MLSLLSCIYEGILNVQCESSVYQSPFLEVGEFEYVLFHDVMVGFNGGLIATCYFYFQDS